MINVTTITNRPGTAPEVDDGFMAIRVAGDGVPGPGSAESARLLAGMLSDPLAGYVRLTARYGDAVRVPFAPRRSWFVLSRPEHAEHVLAANQDNYVKAFTYRPLRALVGDGLLTSEGDTWRRHRRLIQPVFSRRDVTGFGPQMTAAAQRLAGRWTALPDGSLVNVAQEMGALTLGIVGLALFGADLTGDAARNVLRSSPRSCRSGGARRRPRWSRRPRAGLGAPPKASRARWAA